MADLDPALIEKAVAATDSHRFYVNACSCGWQTTGERQERRDNYVRHIARAVLEAVADDLRAEALREAADWLDEFRPFPGEETESLRERADQISPKEEQC